MAIEESVQEWNAYRPDRMSVLVEASGVAKAHMYVSKVLVLAVLAGAFIAFGAAFYLAVIAGSEPLTGLVRFAGGIAFSLGLILVIVGGAELLTGNALMVMALVDGRISAARLLRNWAVVFPGNFAGALLILALFDARGLVTGNLATAARNVAETKFALGAQEAFARGILCNALVCLAVWMSFSVRTAAGKTLVIVFPITAFVALGLEHSVANMFLLPLGLLAGAEGGVAAILANLVPVTLGNVVGGAGGVALAYWIAYRRETGEQPVV